MPRITIIPKQGKQNLTLLEAIQEVLNENYHQNHIPPPAVRDHRNRSGPVDHLQAFEERPHDINTPD